MARGWESKAVEQQQEEARSQKANRGRPLTRDEVAEQRRRESLELSRKRIIQQLDKASNPRHRAMLEAALKDLENQLSIIK